MDLGNRRISIIGGQANASLEHPIASVSGGRGVTVTVEQHRHFQRFSRGECQAFENARVL